jgi:hypothetical protein
MSNALPSMLGHRIARAGAIVLTLIWGSGYAIEGSYLLLVWTDILWPQPRALAERIVIGFEPGLVYLAVFGVLFLGSSAESVGSFRAA